MFESIAESEQRRTGPAGAVVSVLFHAALVLLIFLSYKLAKDIIEPEAEPQVVTFFSAPPPPPPPPPAASTAKKKQKKTDKPKVQPEELVQPQEIPEEQPEEIEVEEEDDGVVGGVLGGVAGGTVGGQIGGVLGGVPGGSGTSLVNLGFDEKSLSFLEKKNPAYPPMAKRNKIEGTVTVEVIFGLDGKVEEAKVVAGPKVFHKMVLDTVKTWRIDPYMSGSQKARVKFRSRINFFLRAAG
jgi:protein TonB